MLDPPEETARLRVAEQRVACAVVGVKYLTVLDRTRSGCAPAARTRATAGWRLGCGGEPVGSGR